MKRKTTKKVLRSTRRKGESTIAWLRRNNPDKRYPLRDASGMRWRMVGSRPVSALADQVMADCGLQPEESRGAR